MALSQEMSKFLNELTGTPRDKFRQRIDSESDAFIDEFLREIRSDSFERAYVLGVQQKRRHQEIVRPHPLVWWSLGIAILSLAIAILAWWFPREPQPSSPPSAAHSPTAKQP